MGGTSSAHQEEAPVEQQTPLQYPDMNVIFRGIPKMMQVADDMHRMTDYIRDLRNMTLGLGILSMVGLALFVILRIAQSRRASARHKPQFGCINEIGETLSLSVQPNRCKPSDLHGSQWEDLRAKAPSCVVDVDKLQIPPRERRVEAAGNVAPPRESAPLVRAPTQPPVGHPHGI